MPRLLVRSATSFCRGDYFFLLACVFSCRVCLCFLFPLSLFRSTENQVLSSVSVLLSSLALRLYRRPAAARKAAETTANQTSASAEGSSMEVPPCSRSMCLHTFLRRDTSGCCTLLTTTVDCRSCAHASVWTFGSGCADSEQSSFVFSSPK